MTLKKKLLTWESKLGKSLEKMPNSIKRLIKKPMITIGISNNRIFLQ